MRQFDRVLRWVSEQLQGCLNSYDILGRMGGDEFTALLELEFPEQEPYRTQQLYLLEQLPLVEYYLLP